MSGTLRFASLRPDLPDCLGLNRLYVGWAKHTLATCLKFNIPIHLSKIRVRAQHQIYLMPGVSASCINVGHAALCFAAARPTRLSWIESIVRRLGKAHVGNLFEIQDTDSSIENSRACPTSDLSDTWGICLMHQCRARCALPRCGPTYPIVSD